MAYETSFSNRLNSLIDQHLEQTAYSADMLCRDLGVSRSTLIRLVKEQTGLTVALYIRQRRLLMAQRLLETTDLRITEIADQVGFNTPSDLSRYFAEAFGHSPSDFRRRALQDTLEPVASLDQRAAALPADGPLPTRPVPAVVDFATPPQPAPRRRVWLLGGLLAAGVLLAALGWLYRDRPNGPDPNQPVALAVLPFQNLGASSSQYYTDGVVEQIHGLLTRVDGLKVISRTSAARFGHASQRSMPQIASELGVAYLLTGEVRQMADRVNVSVELVQVADDRTIWADSYEGQTKDVFGFMSQTARQIAGELNRKLSEITQQKLTQAPTLNIDAYNEYLKGQYLLRTRTEAGIRGSIAKFDRAIALDSGFAYAYASRGQAHLLYADDGFGPTAANYKKAEKDVLTAIRLDPNNGLAYAMLAILYEDQGKWEQATTTFPIALRFSPNDSQINYWYSLALRSTGQTEAALRYSTKALNLDPLHPVIMMGHIGNQVAAGRFNEAWANILEGRRLHSQFPSLYWMTGVYYINLKQYGLAIAEFEKGRRLVPTTKDYPTMIAYCRAKLGQTARARAWLDSLPDVSDQDHNRAVVYAGLGDADRCLTYLERGAEAGSPPIFVKVSPLYTFLHGNPRFEAILRQVGLSTR